MKSLITLCLLALLTPSTWAIEPEPDWNKRLEAIRSEELAKSPPPSPGQRVTITRRVGGELTGSITSIEPDAITIHGRRYEASQLTPESCDKIFATARADKIAQERVYSERSSYAYRQQQEIKARQQQADQQARARLAAQPSRPLQPAITRAPQPRQQAYQPVRAAKPKPNDNLILIGILTTIGVIIACVLGFGLYILPTIIAFKRSHDNAPAILALNILLGWTFLGWVAAFVWSMTAVKK